MLIECEFMLVTYVVQSDSGPSPSEVKPSTSLPAVPEGAMGDNEEYQEITEDWFGIKMRKGRRIE